ncbi:SNF2 domain-containing protein / helicase domain-containing protein / HNH endonuclease domain-containing protein isoform X2 [Wolffia australiana]
MEITEEQRKRAEANRLAALDKRRRLEGMARGQGEWTLSKCQGLPVPLHSGCSTISSAQGNKPPLSNRFAVSMEICSPEEFSVTPKPLTGFPFPGEAECVRELKTILSDVPPFCYVEVMGCRQSIIYKLQDYHFILSHLKMLRLQLYEVPFVTLTAIEKSSSHSSGDRWAANRAPHLSEDEINVLLYRLPKTLRNALLPFQLEGVRFGLKRGGCCLIADEMGLGKTIQAIAIACCFLEEGPILIVCPAILRFSWAEELERWLPICLPADIHLVFGHLDKIDRLPQIPKFVVISYTMLHRIRRSILWQKWSLMIVDESHNIRCTKKAVESEETKAVIDVASKTERIVLLSGTPSLSRPYDIFHQINILWPNLLGRDKYEFAKKYCSMRFVRGHQGRIYKDFSSGTRLEELNLLLKMTVMIRRLKEHVLTQLPPKRRQVIKLSIKKGDALIARMSSHNRNYTGQNSDINLTHGNHDITTNGSDGDDDNGDDDNDDEDDGNDDGLSHGHGDNHEDTFVERAPSESNGEKCCVNPKDLSYQEIGVAKLSGFCEWFSNHFVIDNEGIESFLDEDIASQKIVIFAHHLKVLDGIQDLVCEKGIQFVRIDGATSPRDRKLAVDTFNSCKEVKVAIIGITAGGVGLDFSSAQNIVFLELPKSASEMLQADVVTLRVATIHWQSFAILLAEDRAHRRGQKNAVNIYIFCAKDTKDESHWIQLNKSLYRVSSMMNGKFDAIKQIQVDSVLDLARQADPSSVRPEISSVEQRIPNNEMDKGIEITLSCQSLSVNEGSFLTDMRKSEVDANGLGEECCKKNEIVHAQHKGECSTTSYFSDSSYITTLKNETELCSLSGKTIEIINMTSSDIHESCVPEPSGDACAASNMHILEDENVKFSSSEIIDIKGGKEHTNFLFPEDSLRFEVSRYTGRIHLYLCDSDADTRPRPLHKNFRPEEVDAELPPHLKEMEGDPGISEKPAYWEALKSFMKEWNNLRPIERKNLLGKPLQLPLLLELCYLKESINHKRGGLLRGGSKRRITPLTEINCVLPENAVWKRVTLRRGPKSEKVYLQAWMNNGPLCKFCQSPCSDKVSMNPEFFEDLFCNLNCFQEFRTRTSQRYLREDLFQIEYGICVLCKLDCHRLIKCIKPLSVERRRAYISQVAPQVANKRTLLEKLANNPTEGNAWHADHIIPVYKGGGECKLENMRTLCVACHSDVTAAQREDRRRIRTRAKERLKTAMHDLQVEKSDDAEDDEEDELFVKVPGSAYSVQDDDLVS